MHYSFATLALLAATAAAAPAAQINALSSVARPVTGFVPAPVSNVIPSNENVNNNNGNTSNAGSNNTENTNTNTNTSADNRNTSPSVNPTSEQAAAAPNSNTDNRADTTVQDCSAQNKVMSCCSIKDVTSNNDNDFSSSVTSVDITKQFTQTEFTQIIKSFDLDITRTAISQVFAGQLPTVSRVTRRQATAGSTIACTPQNSCNNNQQPQCFDNDISTGPIFFTLIQQPNTQAANVGSS